MHQYSLVWQLHINSYIYVVYMSIAVLQLPRSENISEGQFKGRDDNDARHKNVSSFSVLFHTYCSTDTLKPCSVLTPHPSTHKRDASTPARTAAAANVDFEDDAKGTAQSETSANFSIDDCRDNVSLHFYGSTVKKTLWGLTRERRDFNTTSVTCQWTITVPDEYFVAYSVRFHMIPCTVNTRIHVSNTRLSDQCSPSSIICSDTVLPSVIFTKSKRVDFMLKDTLNASFLVPRFEMHFWATTGIMQETLPIVFSTPTSGSMTSPEYDGVTFYPTCINATNHLLNPRHYVVMISFQSFHTTNYASTAELTDYLEISAVQANDSLSLVARVYWTTVFPATVYETSLYFRFVTVNSQGLGFKMLFSFHPATQAPVRLSTGLFDCSVPHYLTFRQHLHCNLEDECQNREDEGPHCPFSSRACNGSVAYRDKCYSFVSRPYAVSWVRAEQECKRLGRSLATMRTTGEREGVLQLYQYGKNTQPAFVGLTGYKAPMPGMYRESYRWTDGTIAYNINIGSISNKLVMYDRTLCTFVDIAKSSLLRIYCNLDILHNFICQLEFSPESKADRPVPSRVLQNPENISARRDMSLFICPNGHVTHTFFASDVESACLPRSDVDSLNGIRGSGMAKRFPCKDSTKTISYTLVCDFKQDCLEGSDENFCIHRETCTGFQCKNGQCIDIMEYCDAVSNCWDGSDEVCDQPHRWETPKMWATPSRIVINFDGTGHVTKTPITDSQSCPGTHFLCPDGNCLPVYVVCNGVHDCVGHEDEMDCQDYSCPTLYRCRNSSVCLHSDHLCDGWPQCPLHDDEMYCGLQCPVGCRCQGLVLVCVELFSNENAPSMRYLDASGSNMTPQNLTRNDYLVFLKLASCRLQTLVVMDFPNLQHLDLSHNQLHFLDTDVLRNLVNLKILRLIGNPIFDVFRGSSVFSQESLAEVDLSFTKVNIFASDAFNNFRNIRCLNMSNSKVHKVTGIGLSPMQNLQIIDLRGNEVTHFPGNLFKGLSHLMEIYADNYRLCCKEMLPLHFDAHLCWAPGDELSSCADLLRSDLYRIFIWVFSLLSTTGNAACLIVRLFCSTRSTATGYNVFVTSLSVADFCMGLYLMIIALADLMYRGEYLWYEPAWHSSIACQIAGFLALLSSEMSAFSIFLITLDRFIVLQFPFTRFQFQRRSATVTCCIAWVVSVFIAIVPLLPVTSHWNFYSQNGICLPLPVTRKIFSGRNYSFGVMVGLNSFLFALIAIGQVFIFFSIRSNTMTTNTTQKSQDITIARRLITVVVSDFLCWFPIGVLGIMTALGTAVSSEVNIIIVIFVLPVNSALNPYLYTFNMLMERKRKKREIAFLKQLESQLASLQTAKDIFKP